MVAPRRTTARAAPVLPPGRAAVGAGTVGAVGAHRPSLRERAGTSALRVLTGVLLAVSIGVLVRPVALVAAAAADDDPGGLGPALAATALHVVVVVLAVSLFLRVRRPPPPG